MTAEQAHCLQLCNWKFPTRSAIALFSKQIRSALKDKIVIAKLPIIYTQGDSFDMLECLIEYDRTIAYAGEELCILSFKQDELGEHSFKGIDIFESFCKLRKFLEEKGLKILCRGAQYNVYPSSASRNMTGGYKLYIYRMGEHPQRTDMVKIFDPADVNEVGTVQEQIDYHNRWIESVTKG